MCCGSSGVNDQRVERGLHKPTTGERRFKIIGIILALLAIIAIIVCFYSLPPAMAVATSVAIAIATPVIFFLIVAGLSGRADREKRNGIEMEAFNWHQVNHGQKIKNIKKKK